MGLIFSIVPHCSTFPSDWIMDHSERKWRPVSGLSCQHRTGQKHKAWFMHKEKFENLESRETTAVRREVERERAERGERADAKAAKRQLAQRCVCPIFSFPNAHLQLKQLLEHLHTKRLYTVVPEDNKNSTGNFLSGSGVPGKKMESRPSALLSSGCLLGWVNVTLEHKGARCSVKSHVSQSAADAHRLQLDRTAVNSPCLMWVGHNRLREQSKEVINDMKGRISIFFSQNGQ